MPRRSPTSAAPSGPLAELKEGLGLSEKKEVMGGYEVESVCLHCLTLLQGQSDSARESQC